MEYYREKNYFQILNCRFYKKYSTGNLLPKILSFLDLKVNSLHKSKFVYNFSVVGGAFVTQLTLGISTQQKNKNNNR